MFHEAQKALPRPLDVPRLHRRAHGGELDPPDLAPQFGRDVRAASRVYDPLKTENEELILDGRLDEANRRLLAAVPGADRTAAHDFVLGNLLYRLDPELSRQLHAAAYDRAPDHPLVALEHALQEHRSGHPERALACYASCLSGAEDPGILALMAECHVRLGDLEEAVELFRRADIRTHHNRIERAAFWIHGGRHPALHRHALLRRIRSGDLDAAEPLILLDLHYEIDWWNTTAQPDRLAHDLDLARKLLGSTSPRVRTLDLLIRIETGEEPLEPALERARLVGDDPVLPENTRVAAVLYGALRRRGVVETPWILARFEDDLLERARSKKGDPEAVRMLAACYQDTEHPELDAIDRLGWERYRIPECLGSRIGREPTPLRRSNPLLVEAVTAFPMDRRFARLAVESVDREGYPLHDDLVRAILAEYSHLDDARPLAHHFDRLDAVLHP